MCFLYSGSSCPGGAPRTAKASLPLALHVPLIYLTTSTVFRCVWKRKKIDRRGLQLALLHELRTCIVNLLWVLFSEKCKSIALATTCAHEPKEDCSRVFLHKYN